MDVIATIELNGGGAYKGRLILIGEAGEIFTGGI